MAFEQFEVVVVKEEANLLEESKTQDSGPDPGLIRNIKKEINVPITPQDGISKMKNSSGESFYAGSSRGKKRQSERSRRRAEQFRQTKGAINMENLQDNIRKSLNIGTSEQEAFAPLFEQQFSIRALTLSITTRGIGLGLCHLTYISISCHQNILVPSIYVMYRVFLGLVEAKLEYIKKNMPVVPRLTEHSYQYRVTSDMLIAQCAPEPMRKIINAIGHLKYEDKIYVPAVAASVVDTNERFVPRPETVLLSNLRRTVVTLSDPQSPRRYRDSFLANNSIPGTIWADGVLMNPNDIIPEGYDLVDDFRTDSLLIAPYMALLQKYMPKMGGGPVDLNSTGKPSLLVSNEMGNLRVPNRETGENLDAYYRRCLPQGNVRNYYAAARLTPSELIEGQVNLLGEYPDPEDLRYPMYILRDEVSSLYNISSDYAGVCQIMNAM